MEKVPFDDLSLPLDSYGEGSVGVLLAHGAGTHRGHDGVVGIARALQERGLSVVTFDYPHVVQGRKVPGSPKKSLAAHQAVVEFVRPRFDQLIMAGRSFGGRLSTMLSADGVPADALVALGYPLHPPGKPDKLRIDHLPDMTAPALFHQGTNDALARAELVKEHLEPVGKVAWLDGGSHSMRVKGRSDAETFGLLADRTRSWLQDLGIGRLGSGPSDTIK
ncbi:MAG: dienelactone hydrolase [Acidimicrobiia bacterium]|nr:dienelactone hydrolase [Acidimicrobiia bacterium]